MRAFLAPALVAVALLPFAVTACGSEAGSSSATTPPTTLGETTPPPTTVGRTTPPPATEMSAVSRDTQAKLTAKGAAGVVEACHATTHDYRRCTTSPGTELGRYPAADWGNAAGQVSVTATRRGYALDSHSYSGAHFVIEQVDGGAARQTCRDSVSECASGTW